MGWYWVLAIYWIVAGFAWIMHTVRVRDPHYFLLCGLALLFGGVLVPAKLIAKVIE